MSLNKAPGAVEEFNTDAQPTMPRQTGVSRDVYCPVTEGFEDPENAGCANRQEPVPLCVL